MNKSESEKKTAAFLAAYEDKIQEVVNQDAVRFETLKRETDSGAVQEMLDNVIPNGAYTYAKAIRCGFSEDQAFKIAMSEMGL